MREWEREFTTPEAPEGRNLCLLLSTRAEFKSGLPHPNILHILFEELLIALLQH